MEVRRVPGEVAPHLLTERRATEEVWERAVGQLRGFFAALRRMTNSKN